MDTPIQSNRTTRCNSLSRAPNSSCGSRYIPIAFDTPTSDSNRVAAESRDPSVASSVRIQQTLRDCRLKRWMSQILGTLQPEKRPPSTSELRNHSGRAVREARCNARGISQDPENEIRTFCGEIQHARIEKI